ncbi:5'-(N(7)-methyl 5'-triphosphoguanosine)-[mRNA] diphosphatase [Malassezia vespertilionis]|uniref:Uncharacterized protein n=1 Tax=Malassezia vespertilionis TaxID=2020962 RepID=A0A2N1JDL7_9BASI|nr:5'-(N(7)-methyl 5'-triphosphoguanosine)-[mRNA] diphosphatase [Malassezia vespertilionis]PKI84651.1 hypothetical protein MVES_001771 [Malassezia vespertilionis]WFD06522.1 5'-(N(7)-methyl 5'-triphosphoguanosine)-[mRNA] diphosphatase [Malassezia vespertilionis]
MHDTLLSSFRLERVINEDPRAKSINLLGECTNGQNEKVPAVLLMEKAHYSREFIDLLQQGPTAAFLRLESIGQNDVYHWVFGWTNEDTKSDANSKMTLICPAAPEVVVKYSAQERRLIVETQEIYQRVTHPWIESIPASKTAWVGNILDGVKERSSVLYRDDDPRFGFVLLPDMKWDRRTLSSLYLVAIVQDANLKNLRDLTKAHIPMLRNIQKAGAQVATETYGLLKPSTDGTCSSLRCYLHYMPTFLYVLRRLFTDESHLHIHILSVNYVQHPGAIVGQAQLLDDVISLLELGVDFQQRTLGYALTENHGLFRTLLDAGYGST